MKRLPNCGAKGAAANTIDYLHTPASTLVVSTQCDMSLTAALHGVGITVSSVPVVLSFLRSTRLPFKLR